MKLSKRYRKFLIEFSDIPETARRGVAAAAFREDNATELQELMDYYDCTTKTVAFDRLDELPQITLHKSVPNRATLVEWAKRHHLDIPLDCRKSGYLSPEDAPRTYVTHTFETPSCKIEIFYSREGFPSPTCKIKKKEVLSVSCETSDVPF